MASLNSSSKLKRNPDMVFSEMDGETVMMSIENSEYYGLDPVASRIWELLDQPATVEQLVEKLLEEYEVDHDTCLDDVLSFSQELMEKKILSLV
jgi:hypothetical protein